MKTNKLILTIAVLLGSTPTFAANATPDYYKCVNKEGGEWNYGRVPNVCSANSFGSDSMVYSDYPELIFADPASRTTERNRYVTEMYATIREAAAYYIKRRKPAVSATEVEQFKLGIQLTAAHESKMSHYRKTTDTRLKLMRGDVGHGHGMMQIDDRAHYDAINNGIAWNLITNLTYAMDIFYAQWERAPSQSCVGSATNWKSRIRAAWAAYNGGPGSICRFTNPNSAWAKNDKNFLDMYDQQTWKSYLTNANLPASIDVGCMIEKRENCSSPGHETAFNEGKLYQLPNKSTCAYLGGKLNCVVENRDAICLKSLGSVDITASTVVSGTEDKTVVNHDRHVLCGKYDTTVIAVGEYLKTQININLRATPGGGLLVTVPANQVLQVSDFELRNAPANDRYYQITYNGQKGYLYAGDSGDHTSWVVETTPPVTLPSTLARVGEGVQVVNSVGINMRSTPGGTLIRLVPRNTTMKVIDYVIQGETNEVYYLVKYSTSTGYIYSGTLKPTNTMASWTKRIP